MRQTWENPNFFCLLVNVFVSVLVWLHWNIFSLYSVGVRPGKKMQLETNVLDDCEDPLGFLELSGLRQAVCAVTKRLVVLRGQGVRRDHLFKLLQGAVDSTTTW